MSRLHRMIPRYRLSSRCSSFCNSSFCNSSFCNLYKIGACVADYVHGAKRTAMSLKDKKTELVLYCRNPSRPNGSQI